jgi:hypothetical protein
MTGKLKTLLLAAAAGAMMTMTAGAMAQAPGGGPGAGGPPRGGPGAGAPLDRAGAIQQFGLGDAALNLTAAQKAELDKAADAYVTAMTAVNAQFPRAAGAPPSAEATAARAKPREDMNAAVAKVLTADQKKTWDAAQAARPRGGAGGFGGGPPGGGAGGPPGGRPGGAPGGPPGGGPGGPPGGARPPGQ